MIYECRLNRLKRRHLYTALLTILGLYLLSYFDFDGAQHWWAISIGVVLATAAMYLIGNTRVHIEINNEIIVVEHSGMVHANLAIDSIADVHLKGAGSMRRIVVVTSEGLKHSIPCECFDKNELDELLEKLKGA